MAEIVWLTAHDIIQIHDGLIADSGGLPGLRSFGALESMLQRVRNVAYYEDEKDLVRLAGTLGFSIVEGHVFNDGNKRTALIAVVAFLDLNGLETFAPPLEFADQLLAIADKRTSAFRFVDWLRARTRLPD